MKNENIQNRECNSISTPYTIERPASGRPLEAYVVGRVYQLEAQVEDQKNHILQLKDTLDRVTCEYRKLLDILKPEVKLTADRGMRKIEFDGIPMAYCKYSRDNYYKLVPLLGLQQENYWACMQEYENEILNGTETDLSDDERAAAKAYYETKSKNEGDDKHAN